MNPGISGSHPVGKLAVGLDVGTTKICAIAGRFEEGRTKIISVGMSPSFGLRKGIVVDIESATGSIRKALVHAEKTSGIKIKSVYVGIAGGHIKGFSGYGAVGIKGGLIREDDVARLMDSASAVCVPVDREILHVIPSGFRLNGRNGVRYPVGMRCDRLEADVHIVTGSVTSVRNLITCCEGAGVEVADIVLEPLASADAVLTRDEKERGVALVDIGGGTTDIALYRDGMPRHTAVLTVGGNHITNDIAVGLGITAGEAEKIKKSHGYSIDDAVEELETVEVRDSEGRIKNVPASYLIEIIESRCEEIMALVAKELASVRHPQEAREGGPLSVVMTGGTSLLSGIERVAGRVIGVPVRVGIPEDVFNNSLVSGPEYATGVGLVHFGLDHMTEQAGGQVQSRFTPVGIFERMKTWVREYF